MSVSTLPPSRLPGHPLSARPAAPQRDPAVCWRVFWLGLALVLLWPLGVATEFRPWVLWEPDNRKVTAQFLWPAFGRWCTTPNSCAWWRSETWRTVAMATAGVTLALVLAVPLSLMATRVLSLSALSGRMDRWPAVVRWLRAGNTDCAAQRARAGLGTGVCARGGLGRHGRRAGHCPDLRRHAGQGVRRNFGERRKPRHTKFDAQRQRPSAGLCVCACCPATRPSWRLTRCTAGNARSARRWCWALWARGAWGNSSTTR